MAIDGGLLMLVTPLVVGVVAAIGDAVPKKRKPLVALVVGLVLGLVLSMGLPLDGDDLRTGFVTGLVAALTASGLWSQVDTMTGTREAERMTEPRHITEQECRQIARSAVSSMSLSGIFITPEQEAQHAAWLFHRVNDPEWRGSLRKWRGEGQE
jgi:hypothetical protein